MRTLVVFGLITVTILSLAGCKKKQISQSLKQSSDVAPHRVETLEPEDLGVFKFVFEATPPADCVMVLRWTRIVPDHPSEVQDTVHINTYRPTREVVLIYNSRFFPFSADPHEPTQVLVKTGGDQRRLPPGTDCAIVQSHDEPLALHFSNKERWTYKCFIETYSSAKSRIPDLPAAPTNGGWSATRQIHATPQ